MRNVLITNREGDILLSRYFDAVQVGSGHAGEGHEMGNAAGLGTGSTLMRDRASAMRSAESEILEQTRHLWTKGTAEFPQVARIKGGLVTVFGAVDDLLVFLCGSGEYNELTLADTLATLAKVLTTLCRQGSKAQRATEAALMASTGTGSTYSKACLAVDEMLTGGVLESLHADAILSAIKLQDPAVVSK